MFENIYICGIKSNLDKMIVEFSVKNFRSISDLQTISFVATNLKSSKENEYVDLNNIVTDNKTRLLKTIGIYGANASGKSNIVKALEYFCEAVSDLPSPESRLFNLAQPFIYQNDSEDTESFFQIVLMLEGKKYRYGFTVKRNLEIKKNNPNASKEIITNEWLFGPKKTNQGKFFSRENLKVDKSNLPGSENIAPLEYEHTLFLTHAASYNKDICAKIRNIIKGSITYQFNIRNDFYRFHSIRQIEDVELKTQFLDFLKSFGLNYDDIYFDRDKETANDYYPLEKLFLLKTAGHDNTENIVLNMQYHESEGTKKLFDIAGLLLFAFNIKIGGLIILDEIDSNFHPSLLIKLISFFNDTNINKSNAQLLFTSHDTNLMSPSLMRRDQFYFTEKEENEGTRLYSLSELKGIRNDADFAKQYLAGFYGGIPSLSTFLGDKNLKNDGTLEY